MSKSAEIRTALADGALPLSKLMEKTRSLGRKKTLDLCRYLSGRGETTVGTGDDPVIALTGKRGAKQSPAKTPRKKKPNKAARAGKRITVPAPDTLTLSQLIVRNAIAAGEQIDSAIRSEIDGIDDNPILKAALENFGRAREIMNADIRRILG